MTDFRGIAAAFFALGLAAAGAHAAGESIVLGSTETVGGKTVDAQIVARTARATSTTYRVNLAGPVTQRGLEVVLSAGQTSVKFKFTTTPVAQNSNVEICASANPPACDATATFAVLAPRVESLQFNTTTVTSGTAFQGTVTLDGPAPSGGYEVDLLQSPSPGSTSPTTGTCPQLAAGALAPDSVLVPAGQSSVSFAVPTYHFFQFGELNQQNVAIAARAGGAERSQTLTVQRFKLTSFTIQPGAGPRPLNVTVSFAFNGSLPGGQVVQAESQTIPPNVGQTTLGPGQLSGSFPMVLERGKSPVLVRLESTCLHSNNATTTVDLLPPL